MNKEIKIYEEQYYSVKQIAEYLSLTTRTIINYINDGKIASVKIGNSRRIKGKSVNEFIANNTKAN